MDARPVVCFLTDFGLKDHYAGVMKGVILASVPSASFVDVTNEVPAQDVRFGAFELQASVPHFPKGTLFIAVVDPGVGSNRRILYAEAGGWRFLAPDNGLLSWLFDKVPPSVVMDVSRAAPHPESVSRTFHGRDIFAPVAVRLLKGEPPAVLGPAVNDWLKMPFPSVQKRGSDWEGEVLVTDVYGNLITNFETSQIEPLSERSKVWFELNGASQTVRGLAESYSAVEKGKLLAIGGSSGFIEIAVRDGSAARLTGLKAGDKIKLHFRV